MKSLNLLLALSFASFALAAQDFDHSFRENYSVSTPAQLAISSSDGNIELMPGSGSELQVYFIVTKNGRVLDISRAQLEEEVSLTIVKTGSSLDIEVKYPQNYWTLDWTDRLNVNFKVFAPVQTACTLRTSDGNISVQGLSGTQQMKTSDGNIKAWEINGDLTVTTSDGNIQGDKISGKVYSKTSDGDIRFDIIKGGVEATTSDGDIRLTNVDGSVRTTTSDGDIDIANIRGDHYAHTSDGDIYFQDLYGSLDASVSDGNIRGNIVELRTKLRAKTSDGNIDISVPSGIGMDLYVKGESVNVPLQNFSGRSDDDIIDGKTNGGGVDVNLTTSDGRIKLVYR